MSSFYCESCGLPCLDTQHGYNVGCKHHPPDGRFKDRFKTCGGCGSIASDVVDRSTMQMRGFFRCPSCYESYLRNCEPF